MSISAISTNYLYYTNGAQSSTSAAASTNTAGDNDLQAQFQPHHREEQGSDSTMGSESAAAFFSGQMNQGLMALSTTDSQDSTTVNGVSANGETSFSGIMPPPPPQMSADSTSASNQDDPLSSFLAKVESGTVTDSDLTDMQELLSQMQTQADTSAAATTASIMPPPPPPASVQQMRMATQAYDNNMVYQTSEV